MRYPFYKHHRAALRLSDGEPIDRLDDAALERGGAWPERIGPHPETLNAQAELAERHGFRQLAENLRRAAELVGVPDARVLEIYAALRPGRSSAAEIEAIARELEERYQAPRTAAFVRQAAIGGLIPR
jgi:propanediol dehydratase small subunit